MERIAIFAALRWECQPIVRQLRQVARERLAGCTVWRGRSARHEVWLMQTGMGITHAAAAAEALSNADRFALFLSTGCAGALRPDLMPGDLAVATAVISNSSGEQFETDVAQREQACALARRAALRATLGPVLCSPHALVTAAAKQAALARHAAVAVEMEGAPIAARAAQAGVPFVSVRAILDTADTELRQAGRFIDPQSGAVKPVALAGYLVTHPAAWAELRAMQRMMHAAQSSLEKFFSAWFALSSSPLPDGRG